MSLTVRSGITDTTEFFPPFFFFFWVFPFGTGCVENHVSGPIPRRLSLLTSLFPLDPPFNGDNQRRHDRQRAAKNRRDFKTLLSAKHQPLSLTHRQTLGVANSTISPYVTCHREVHIGKAQGDNDDDKANRVIMMTMKANTVMMMTIKLTE